jgi:hypothetical protein
MFRRISAIAAVVLTTAAITIRPTLAAEEISLVVGETELLTLAVADLESYATTGKASKELEGIVTLFPAEKAKKLRDLLTQKTQVKPQPFGQFLDSTLGSKMLNQLGSVVKPKGAGISSIDSLKTAMNTAAAAPEGFSVIDLLKAYPTARILIDQEAANAKQKEIDTLGKDLELLLASMGIKVNPDAMIGLFELANSHVKNVDAFIKSTGIDEAELKGSTPPQGTVTLQKADIYQLYQTFSKLRQQAGQAVSEQTSQ